MILQYRPQKVCLEFSRNIFVAQKTKQQLYPNNGQLEEILLSKSLNNILTIARNGVHAY